MTNSASTTGRAAMAPVIPTETSTYVLDFAEWRCGGENYMSRIPGAGSTAEPTTHGEGLTMLLNEEGFLCCLGQWALQKGLTREQIFAHGTPGHLAQALRYSYDANFVTTTLVIESEEHARTRTSHTLLTARAMAINDNPHTTLGKKVAELAELLGGAGHKLQLKGFPPHICAEAAFLLYAQNQREYLPEEV